MTVRITFFEETGGELTLIPLVIDAAPREEHRANAQATEHEVERGVAVADHVRPERRLLQLEAIITDTPLRATDALGGEVRALGLPDGRTADVFQPDTTPTRVADSWRTLLDARDRSLLAIVETSLETYEDMVKAGVLTPTKVERTALANASEVAILLLTTDCIIVEAPKKAGGGGHDHDHDHGGMDDMM